MCLIFSFMLGVCCVLGEPIINIMDDDGGIEGGSSTYTINVIITYVLCLR